MPSKNKYKKRKTAAKKNIKQVPLETSVHEQNGLIPAPMKSSAGTADPVKLNFSHYFLLLLIFTILTACYQIIEPYLHAIILATILAILFTPIHLKILKWVKNRDSLAATISCFGLIIVVILPLMVMLMALIHQGQISIKAINNWIAAGKMNDLMKHPFLIKMLALADNYLPDIRTAIPHFDPKQMKFDQILLTASQTIGKLILDEGGQILGNLSATVGKFFLMIFSFFFIIRDEKKIFAYMLHLMPLSTSHENQIMEKIKGVARSVLLGTLVTALGQGAAGGVAFMVCGLPGLFWGMMMAFASLIPVVGTALIWVPATGYLLVSGRYGYAAFMVLWCVIVVGMIDNFVRPLFMKESAGMSTLLIFFAILGGINYFGLIGLLYGPLIFGLAMVLLFIYQIEFEPLLVRQDRN